MYLIYVRILCFSAHRTQSHVLRLVPSLPSLPSSDFVPQPATSASRAAGEHRGDAGSNCRALSVMTRQTQT